jgi:hypothetical protein
MLLLPVHSRLSTLELSFVSPRFLRFERVHHAEHGQVTEAWTTLCRHPLDPKVGEHSGKPMSRGRCPKRGFRS